jgi:GR25 family glycosyltransferase involved in LPS biosynthesis
VNLNEYFDKIFIINLDRRTDRWERCQAQMAKFSFNAERFSAHANVKIDGVLNGNAGCTASHRALLEIISYMKWPRTLVLEDDFEIVHEDFEARFSDMSEFFPQEWDMLYLGGHYQNAPQSRYNKHIVKVNGMYTTSSYGITHQFARKIAPYFISSGPVDCIFSGFTPTNNCYICQPRLMVQSASYSDLTESMSDNRHCMLDTSHENMV